jgi:uncharacterized membrane protein YoaK (UPF0700 family)
MRGMTATSAPGRLVLVLLLALGAGAVDAMLITAFQVLTAAQTGNTILLAVAIAQGDWHTGMNSGVSVLGFVFGALAGAWLLARAGWTIRRVLLLETATLSCALALLLLGSGPGTAKITGVILAAACAMGLQSAVMLHLQANSTTYVTGVLAAFARDLVAPRSLVQSTGPPAWFGGGEWVVYFAGAVSGAWLFLHHGPVVMIVPIACLFVAACAAAEPRFD